MVECDSLGEGTFGGTSFLGRGIEIEEVAGEDLWRRKWVSGVGESMSHTPTHTHKKLVS